jgi:ribosomal protein S18 acetylase RimI-like enzyme
MRRDIKPGGRPACPWVVPYDPDLHRQVIPRLFAAAFGRNPWPPNWEEFDEFDPSGVFVARDPVSGTAVGFLVSFPRAGHGYVSVVAVVPEYRRRGLASALMERACDRFHSLGMTEARVDAWEDSPPAVATYRTLGFEVYDRRLEEDG